MLLELPTLKTGFIVHFATAPHPASPVLPAATGLFHLAASAATDPWRAGKIN
jgi:hypothetical protein